MAAPNSHRGLAKWRTVVLTLLGYSVCFSSLHLAIVHMRIIDVVYQLLPTGLSTVNPYSAQPNRHACPGWPPDIFAVVGSIIDRSGCYTEASPDRNNLDEHERYLDEVASIVESWASLVEVPAPLQALWDELISHHGGLRLDEVNDNKVAQKVLFKLFAVADEASQGMGWTDANPMAISDFQMAVLLNAVGGEDKELFPLPHWPTSLCRMVSPDELVVLPKSITTDKGCTVRSLSHNLALLPCKTVLKPEWRLASEGVADDERELRLLLVPFPFEIPQTSFSLASERKNLKNGTTHAAFFKLSQEWLLKSDGTPLSALDLASKLVFPLIDAAKNAAGGLPPHGIIFPECALNESITIDLVKLLRGNGIEFFITGVLDDEDVTKRPLNKAYTVFLTKEVAAPQHKHHRWRIDQPQADSYGLAFDGSGNQQWWEDIDVSKRGLPFYGFRKDTSMVTLICEDLARMEPAMDAIRAIGPNLVVALLMDGPQLGSRWPGRYASVLADEPGCSVLSLTCAATVELSNAHFTAQELAKGKKDPEPQCVIGRWTQAKGNDNHDIVLEDGGTGVLLTVQSRAKHQTTLDNRSDRSQSRELVYLTQRSLVAGEKLVKPT